MWVRKRRRTHRRDRKGYFRLYFFLVAALVSLTTMTRMVEEQRLQIGTLKALGYGKWSIASEYMATPWPLPWPEVFWERQRGKAASLRDYDCVLYPV